ncbi:glycosyltransferase [Gammaproteobacteria bacterium]|nr:glycosyltransferase [Gammaproteobacteria bacterium]
MQTLKNKKTILVICPYPEGYAASQRLKYEQYFDSWREAGYEITISPFFDMDTWKILYEDGFVARKVLGTLHGYLRRSLDLFRLKKYDHVYVCMWVTPLLDSVFERLFLLLSQHLIFDFDDAIHTERDPNNKNLIKKFFKGRKKIKLLIQKSNSVITSSPFNLDYCAEYNKYNSAAYIPCSLDTKRFIRSPRISHDQQLSLGWTGTFTSAAYLDSIKDILQRACLEFNLKLVLITNFDYEIPGIDLEVIRWKKETEIQDLHKIDIGLYPLIESPWALGKGGLKVLQYMSLGIPSISSNFGTAQYIVKDGINGFLVDTMDEWIDRISLLVNDAELRNTMGDKARSHIELNYSTESINSLYLQSISNLSK